MAADDVANFSPFPFSILRFGGEGGGIFRIFLAAMAKSLYASKPRKR